MQTRLLTLAKERREPFQFLLARYGLERLLYRLSRSSLADGFVVKGAMLFTVWSGQPHRSTKDLDLLGFGAPDLLRLEECFRELASVAVDDDGLVFDPATVKAVRIKDGADYEGVRIALGAKLGTAKLDLQVDVGFGDAMTPAAGEVEFPTMLDQPRPRLRAYSKETVIAEKLQAMVHLGLLNSRMKDFFDLWFLAGKFSFELPLLAKAIGATFHRRGTPVPLVPPLALTQEFAADEGKQRQWRAFVSRSGVATRELGLGEVVATLAGFLVPALQAASADQPTAASWSPGGPWSR